jgi:hypothetical protein
MEKYIIQKLMSVATPLTVRKGNLLCYSYNTSNYYPNIVRQAFSSRATPVPHGVIELMMDC